jgi:hypothetical protein
VIEANRSRSLTDVPALSRLLVALGVDYVRWLVLTPMVLTWAFFLFMVVLMLALNFGGPVSGALDGGYDTYRQHFGPAEWLEGDENEMRETEEPAPEGGDTIHVTGDDIVPWVMKAWGLLALTGWLLGMARSLIFGPRPPRTLGQKVKLAMVVAGAGWLLLFGAYFFGSETYHGGFFGWFALFTGSAIAVVAVSAVVLALGILLDRIRGHLLQEDSGNFATDRASTGA